jgi:hypothetical protein
MGRKFVPLWIWLNLANSIAIDITAKTCQGWVCPPLTAHRATSC